MSLTNKIDFAIIIRAENCNPNGDPLDGNRPRLTFDNKGEISDVAMKRKIRDRLQEAGFPIFVQCNEKRNDDFTSLKSRYDETKKTWKLTQAEDKDFSTLRQKACEQWYDVRAFGQVFAFKGDDANVSLPVRGPVSIHPAFSIGDVTTFSQQITKSTNSTGDADKGKSADTMGMKHRIDGEYIYVSYGSINHQLSTVSGFNDEDAVALKNALINLFKNDTSSARPDGSMEVVKLIWWEHNCPHGQYSSAKVHRSLSVNPDGKYDLTNLNGLTPKEIDGF